MYALVGFTRVAILAMIASLSAVLPARADFESGQAAWDEGDVAQAVQQWRSGADEEDARSMLALGRLYRLGVGVLQDDVTAYMWLNLAAARGSLDAARERDELVATMTADARAEGQLLARVWQSGTSTATSAAPEPGSLPSEAIHEAQGLLASLGYELGPADGVWGARSAAAYRTFLHDAGLPSSDELTLQALLSMRALAEQQDVATQVGAEFRDCTVCPVMVVLPRGSFTMGSPPDEKGRYGDEGPQRRVRIGYNLAVGKYAVTVGEFSDFVEATGHSLGWGHFRSRGMDIPAEEISWKDAQTYVSWLAQETGKDYRLLTEAEWEYAARAGTTTAYHTGTTISTHEANFNSDGPVPVGSYPANAFGLHDMHGNVGVWVEDWYQEDSYRFAPLDGSAWVSGPKTYRVIRGGTGWRFDASSIRSAIRGSGNPNLGYNDVGIRVARPVN